MGLILDTNFILTAERDARRGVVGHAHTFLARHSAEQFFITFTVAGELACGQSASARRDWDRLCRPYAILSWSLDVAWRYGEIYRALAAQGGLIGANDMWIAATALAHGFPVVTRNAADFNRVPELVVETY